MFFNTIPVCLFSVFSFLLSVFSLLSLVFNLIFIQTVQ